MDGWLIAGIENKMYGATKPKLTRPNPQGNSAADDNEQMQPLMVDPYFDKSFSPEVSMLLSLSHITLFYFTLFKTQFYSL